MIKKQIQKLHFLFLATDYHLTDVAGKKVDFEVEITEIKEKTLAELTDELVQKSSNSKQLMNLKQVLKIL